MKNVHPNHHDHHDQLQNWNAQFSILTMIILIKTNVIMMVKINYRWCDGGALESAKDEEKAGGEGDRELRHKPAPIETL